jgi:hypothetical protein
MDIKAILEKMDSMLSAEKHSTGPKFPGYWKGKDPASKAKNKMVGSAEESVLPELSKTADDTAILRRLEDAYDKFKNVPEVDYDDPTWIASVDRLKKMASSGPLKTVWDPEKRVYRNVPVSHEKKIEEYGNATDPSQQSTNADQQNTASIGQPTNVIGANTAVSSTQTITDPAALAKQDQQSAQQTAQQVKNVLGTDVQPNLIASAMTKSEQGQQLNPQELQTMGKVNRLIAQAAKSGSLKPALQQAGKALGG